MKWILCNDFIYVYNKNPRVYEEIWSYLFEWNFLRSQIISTFRPTDLKEATTESVFLEL